MFSFISSLLPLLGVCGKYRRYFKVLWLCAVSGECGSGEGGACVSHQGRLLLRAGGMDSQSVAGST